MGKLSADLDAFRKAQLIKVKLDDSENAVMNNLVTEVGKLEDEVAHFRSEVATGDFADFNGDPLQSFVK